MYAVHLYTTLVRAQTLQCHAFIQISDAICSVQSHGIKMQHIALQMQIISYSGLHDWEGVMKWDYFTHMKKINKSFIINIWTSRWRWRTRSKKGTVLLHKDRFSLLLMEWQAWEEEASCCSWLEISQAHCWLQWASHNSHNSIIQNPLASFQQCWNHWISDQISKCKLFCIWSHQPMK